MLRAVGARFGPAAWTRSAAFRRWPAIGEHTPAAATGFGICELELLI